MQSTVLRRGPLAGRVAPTVRESIFPVHESVQERDALSIGSELAAVMRDFPQIREGLSMLRFFLVTLAVAGLASCRPKAQGDTAVTKSAIDSLNTRIEGWYQARQPDSVASLFAQDAWLMAPNAKPVIGADSIRAFWTGLMRMGTVNFDLRSEDLITADSIAVERGQFVIKFTAGPNSPIPTFEDSGNYLTVWRRESDGKLRIVWDAAVSSVPLPVPPPSGVGTERPSS